jgi:sugar phosphate isomerase/epimerase
MPVGARGRPRRCAASLRWNLHRCGGLDAALDEILAAGFDALELCGIDEATAAGAVARLRDQGLAVTSIHAPCPDGSARGRPRFPGDWLASPDSELRSAALRYALASVDLARELGVRDVVYHLGRIDLGDSHERLARLVRWGAPEPVVAAARSRYRYERAEAAPDHLARVRRALDVLCARAADDVTICIEIRYRYEQLPNARDAAVLLAERAGAPVAYWHDAGHAHVQSYLGLLDDDDLVALWPHAAGCHVHDARGTDDHRNPGDGDVRFDRLFGLLPEQATLAFELDPRVTVAAAVRGLELVRRCAAGPEARPGSPTLQPQRK